jgi:hypothetical protein
MRALSPFGRYFISVRREVQEYYATGQTKTVQTGLYAQFYPGDMRPLERELALASFQFNGSYQAEDEVTTIPPDYRIGVFDSIQAQIASGWSDEERILVEETLRTQADLYPSDVLIVPEVRAKPPWPRYDDFGETTSALIAKIIEDGYSFEDVLTYEHENQARPEVLAALEQVVADGEPVEAEEVLG